MIEFPSITFAHPWFGVVALLILFVLGIILLKHVKSKGTVIVKLVVFALVILAIAQPVEFTSTTEVRDQPAIVVVDDKTSSMDIMDPTTFTHTYELVSTLGNVPIISLRGEGTALGDVLVREAPPNGSVVLVSDVNSNQGMKLEDALSLVSRAGSKVHLVRPSLFTNDVSVEIVGEKSVVKGVESTFQVVIRSAEAPVDYELVVKIENNTVLKEQCHRLERKSVHNVSYTFSSIGPHLIQAEIHSTRDANPENNLFIHGVLVVEKPRVLLVAGSETSSLSEVLGALYNIDIVPSLSAVQNLDDYLTVVEDNMPADSFSSSDIVKLKAFVANGGGLLVVGGDRAYNMGNYLGSELESMLPVESKPSRYEGGRSVVMLIDISDSARVYGILDTEKALAINTLFQLGINDNVGVIAFGGDAHELTNGLQSLSGGLDLAALVDSISRLQSKGMSGTSLNKGLDLAGDMLEGGVGSKHVIIISDGAIQSVYQPTLEQARKLQQNGVKMHFVVVKSTNPIGSTAHNLMEEVGGEYYEESDGWSLTLRFGDNASEVSEGTKEPEEFTPYTTYPLVVMDASHFITRYTNISGNVSGFNEVTPKMGAKRLVTIVDGRPVLTVARYGLGRVAALTTDDGSAWAPILYTEGNSKLISATVNWVVGDPQRGNDPWISAPDTFVGRDTTITVIASTPPTLSVDGKELLLNHVGDNTYQATFIPKKVRVFYLQDYPIAVNYHVEYRDVGFNEKAAALIEEYGGKVLTKDEVKLLLTKQLTADTLTVTIKPVDRSSYFLIPALLLFTIDVVIRRIREARAMWQSSRNK